jgi:hypothetical protein
MRSLTDSTLAAVLTALTMTTAPYEGRAAECADCDGDNRVSIGELVTGINIALGSAALAVCRAIDRAGDGEVTVDDLVAAIGDALDGCAPSSSTPTPPSPTATPASPTSIPSATLTVESDPQLPPTETAALRAWLEAGNYLGWAAESGPHPGAGPHFGVVRTFVNDALIASLDAGQPQHPAGAAAVKELYGRGDAGVQGWAVMVKLQDDSNQGRGWYWLEMFGSFTGGGIGAPGCTGCHSSGNDFVRIPFPLQ